MPALASDLRRQLENVCIRARDLAEDAARSALAKRAVDAAEPFSHFNAAEKKLRNRLRARGRQLGDVLHANKTQSIDQLTQELAYEYWHRMLFARFLAENHLLMHPDGVAVSLEECEELARSLPSPGTPGEGSGVRVAPNGFVLAARYASRMLPQVFRTDDVLLDIEFAPEQRLALEKELARLPREAFLADDSLGWVYQFWQTKKKDEVNASGAKIDGRTLPAVTQLFTEDYMVQFLLHNTIGAWWCARHGITGPPGGAGIPAGKAPVEMPYLRWRDDGSPAAGSFDGWPKTLKEFTMLDPCCGSGHFLVNGFNLLVPLRMHDEELSARDACDAVLRENLFGLELDPRCTQIAAFALALAAWRCPGEDGQPLGYRELPQLHIACSGIGPQATEEEWLKLAEQSGRRMTALSREPIRDGLRNLHALFSDAATLGSLIDPNQLPADLFAADYETLKPYLAAALTAEQTDIDAHERAVAAAGMVKAAELLAREYALVITNVPYLGLGKQHDVLKRYLEERYREGKECLSGAFVLRSLDLCLLGGSTALVTPQNWLFLTRYTRMRETLLKERTWNAVAILGEEAWWSFGLRGPRTILHIMTALKPDAKSEFFGIDVSANRGETPILLEEKIVRLSAKRNNAVHSVQQAGQLMNPEAAIAFDVISKGARIQDIAYVGYGSKPGQTARVTRQFWEFARLDTSIWMLMASTPDRVSDYSGRSGVCLSTEQIKKQGIEEFGVRGLEAWGKKGVIYSKMNDLPCSIYNGEFFDDNTNVIIPHKAEHTIAFYAYIKSGQFNIDLRRVNKKRNVTRELVAQFPFDLAYWIGIAARKYPKGLPEPYSDDPTQWLFKGDIATSNDRLQVAVARLLDYRWPEQKAPGALTSGSPDAVDALADIDGIVCLPAVRGGSPASERIGEVLQAAYGKEWSNAILHDLLTAAGCKPGTTLDDWLRTAFFEQHCKRFHHRPFIWHIWDGRKDGFSCLVNYHKLDYQALENLAYSYLGDWIKVQTAEAKGGRIGADLRLGDAQKLQQKLKLILAGEPPYDIFVRWKPLSEQAIGWHPDLNDGVRMNIRPFVEAGILRKNPNIKWTKDRGKEPRRDQDEYPWFWKGTEFIGDRVNDVHVSNAEKQGARKRAEKK